MVLKVIPLRKLYEAIDWQVIVLLRALIPVGTGCSTIHSTRRLLGIDSFAAPDGVSIPKRERKAFESDTIWIW